MRLTRTLSTFVLLPLIASSLPRDASAVVFCEPSAHTSSAPTIIRLVGQNGGGVTDPAGTFTVVVRDAASVPMANRSVVVEVDAIDVVFCAAQDGNFAQHSTTSVQGFTDAA